MTQHRGARYSADEILLFARSNRGYGLERMIKMIYFENGTKKAQNQSRYFTDALGVLMKHNESSGEELYACIQDPEMTILVTRQRWLRETGMRYVPKGYGQSQGGRASKLSMKNPRGDHMNEVPLPPQHFDWAGIIPIWER